jgi:uncharacterized RDD family membrane protein YckC
MTWYYASGGKQMGPVDEAALDDLVRQGVVRDDTLVWKSGMAGWQPHSSVRGFRPQPPPPSPPPAAPVMASPMPAAPASVETRFCSECGRSFPVSQLSMMAGGAAVCAACYPGYAQRMGMGAPQTMGAPAAPAAAGAWHYGGFWIRFVARLIDAVLIGIVGIIIRIPLTIIMGGSMIGLGSAAQDNPAAALAALPMIIALGGISFVIQIALSLGYEVYFLTTRGATLGKIALGLKVVRADGGPISAGLAAGRFFAGWLSGMILCIGYIMAAFDEQKRSLHDRICDTRVIYAK